MITAAASNSYDVFVWAIAAGVWCLVLGVAARAFDRWLDHRAARLLSVDIRQTLERRIEENEAFIRAQCAEFAQAMAKDLKKISEKVEAHELQNIAPGVFRMPSGTVR